MKGYVVVKRDSDRIVKGYSTMGAAKQVAAMFNEQKHYDSTGRYYVCRVTATEVVE